MRERWSDKFFSLTRGERYVATFFISGITIALLISSISRSNIEEPELVITEKEADTSRATPQITLEESQQKSDFLSDKNKKKTPLKVTSFPTFCPDTLTPENWRQLGLSARQAQGIINYRKSLSKNFDSTSFYQCYVLPKDFYSNYHKKIVFRPAPISPLAKKITLDLNKASAKDFQKIDGIGKIFAQRIIAYRKLLGGFYSSNQFSEVYGLDTSCLQLKNVRFIFNTKDLSRIDLNNCTKEDLAKHPYVSYKMAKIILNFTSQRSENGTLNDLYTIEALNDDELKRIMNYLSWND